jgi:hypothetical protein
VGLEGARIAAEVEHLPRELGDGSVCSPAAADGLLVAEEVGLCVDVPVVVEGAPRGAMRKEMKDDIHLIRAGWKAGPGCCSGLEKLGTAEALNRAPEVERPDR